MGLIKEPGNVELSAKSEPWAEKKLEDFRKIMQHIKAKNVKLKEPSLRHRANKKTTCLISTNHKQYGMVLLLAVTTMGIQFFALLPKIGNFIANLYKWEGILLYHLETILKLLLTTESQKEDLKTQVK